MMFDDRSKLVGRWVLAVSNSKDAPPVYPTLPSLEVRKRCLQNLQEQLLSLATAFGLGVTVGYNPAGGYECSVDETFVEPDTTIALEAAAHLDLYITGTMVVCGFPQEAALNETVRSLFSMFGDDGKPIRDEDGELVSGKSYRSPNYESVLLHASEQAGEFVQGLKRAEDIHQDTAHDVVISLGMEPTYKMDVAPIHVSMMDVGDALSQMGNVCQQGTRADNASRRMGIALSLRRAAWRVEFGNLNAWVG